MLEGPAFLALWNGVEPHRAPEYDLWHTREHVPERVHIPGMLSARRYSGGEGTLPAYLTLYDLEAMDVLESAPYRDLLGQPTEWSRSMRPSFRGFLRLPCHRLASHGGGLGGTLLAATLRVPAGQLGDLRAAARSVEGALALAPVVAAHLGLVDPAVASVPFTIGGVMPDYPRDAVLLLEGYDRAALRDAVGPVKAWLKGSGLPYAHTAWTSYDLAYVVTRDDLARVVTHPHTTAA